MQRPKRPGHTGSGGRVWWVVTCRREETVARSMIQLWPCRFTQNAHTHTHTHVQVLETRAVTTTDTPATAGSTDASSDDLASWKALMAGVDEAGVLVPTRSVPLLAAKPCQAQRV